MTRSRFIAAVVGMVLAWPLMHWWPDPFVPRQHYFTAPQFSDAEKKSFFATFIATFDAGNPDAEVLDRETNTRTEISVLKKYYEDFNNKIKRIASTSCSKKTFSSPTRWQNEEAKDREFIVFDIETCQPLTQGKN